MAYNKNEGRGNNQVATKSAIANAMVNKNNDLSATASAYVAQFNPTIAVMNELHKSKAEYEAQGMFSGSDAQFAGMVGMDMGEFAKLTKAAADFNAQGGTMKANEMRNAFEKLDPETAKQIDSSYVDEDGKGLFTKNKNGRYQMENVDAAYNDLNSQGSYIQKYMDAEKGVSERSHEYAKNAGIENTETKKESEANQAESAALDNTGNTVASFFNIMNTSDMAERLGSLRDKHKDLQSKIDENRKTLDKAKEQESIFQTKLGNTLKEEDRNAILGSDDYKRIKNQIKYGDAKTNMYQKDLEKNEAAEADLTKKKKRGEVQSSVLTSVANGLKGVGGALQSTSFVKI
jgi:hypothetical protein